MRLPVHLVIYFLLHGTIAGEINATVPCAEVCECYEDPTVGLVADCSRRNLRNLPSRLPKETRYADFSDNAISTLLPVTVADLPRSLRVVDLSDNPLKCNDSTLRSLKSFVTLKSNCQHSNLVADYDLRNADHISAGTEKIRRRTRRAILGCEDGWKEYESSCYKYFDLHYRWSFAKGECNSLGADLAKITSREVHDFVYKLRIHQSSSVWIGLRQWMELPNFVWTDGSHIGNFTFWNTGEPLVSTRPLCVRMSSAATNGQWEAVECANVHSTYVCEKASLCHLTSSGCEVEVGFEKPRITSFRRLENTSVYYDSKVKIECVASGFPRPTVSLFVNNASRANEITSGHSVTVPYVTNLTLKLKMTSEVQCEVSNIMGRDFEKMRIEMKDDSVYFKAVLRLPEVPFTEDLRDPLSSGFKTQARSVEEWMKSIFAGVVRDVNIVAFRKGSVVADILLNAAKGTPVEEIQHILENDAVQHLVLGNAVLESLGEVKACEKEFFNVTWNPTFGGEDATQICPRGASGESTRHCKQNGIWNYPDYSHCSSEEFVQLKEKVDRLFNLSDPSIGQVSSVISSLAELTKPRKYDAMMAGDIKISTQILSEVVKFNERFANGNVADQGDIEGFIQVVSNLLDFNNKEDFTQLQKTDQIATNLARIVEEFGLQAAATVQNTTNRSFNVVKDNIAMDARVILRGIQEPVRFPSYSVGLLSSPLWTNDGKQHITLPKTLFNGKQNPRTNETKVASFLFRTLDSFLGQNSVVENEVGEYRVQSRIISSSVLPAPGKLDEPVVIEFSGIEGDEHSLRCVYWNYSLDSRGGGWSTDGCLLASSDNDTVRCECNHLTNFAVLVDTTGISSKQEKHRKALDYITLAGCSLSILGLIITLIVHFIFWRNLKSPKTTIHVNFCAALLMANIFILIGSRSTEFKNLCTAISILLHYFFLSAVFWMLAQGLQIYSAIIHVFSATEWQSKYYYILGWGVPFGIIIPCLGITRTEGYGSDETCWLSLESGLIWTFIVPCVVVILINGVIFFWVLRAMMTSHKMIMKSLKEKIRRGIKSCLVLFPLLGLTWVFGLLAFDKHTVVFLYLFAVINSLQGFFVFVFHCALDQQVWAMIAMWQRKRVQTTQYRTSELGANLKVLAFRRKDKTDTKK
ncbi:adhesion G protein-coupled receptor L3-like isoform X5 [Acropora muricata]